MGGLSLETRNGPQEDGQPGHAVAPNDVEPSLTEGPLSYAGDLKMPLGRRRSEEVELDFEGWIRMGAPDPSEVEVWVPGAPSTSNKARSTGPFKHLGRP